MLPTIFLPNRLVRLFDLFEARVKNRKVRIDKSVNRCLESLPAFLYLLDFLRQMLTLLKKNILFPPQLFYLSFDLLPLQTSRLVLILRRLIPFLEIAVFLPARVILCFDRFQLPSLFRYG